MHKGRRMLMGGGLMACSLLLTVASNGQQATAASDGQTAALEKRLDALMDAVDGVRHQIADSQRQMEELGAAVRQVQAELAASGSPRSAGDLSEAVDQLRQQSDVQQAEIKQHEQTKVESASKYPVRLSGLILFSSFLNDGAVNDIDLPTVAVERTHGISHGDLAGTMRQTSLGLEATGPRVGNARTSADVNIDFFGGQPYNAYSSSAGIVRLRTAHMRMEWERTAAIAGYDVPLITGAQPTSVVSHGVPPLAWSGNLWTWAPQIEVRHSVQAGRGIGTIEGGLIDASSPGLPATVAVRQAGAGESSRQPGYEGRLSYAFGNEQRAFRFGAGGYYSRQRYSYGQRLDSWAGTADLTVPIRGHVELSGALYRGRAIGGLGGGAFKDYYIDQGSNQVRGLNAEGGWAQFKVRATRRLEANAAIGLDDAFAEDLRYTAPADGTNVYSALSRNRTVFANVIYRPRAYLMLSAEYREISSWNVTGPASTAQGLGLAAGYIF